MFAIFKNGKKTVRRTFSNYDLARCYVRKLIRERALPYKVWGALYSNPNLGDYDYSIKRI